MTKFFLSEAFWSFLGQLIVGLLALFGVMYSLRRNVRTKIISASRNEWNILMRNSVAKMLAEAEMIVKYSNEKEKNSEHCKNYCEARNRVLVRINDKELKHKQLEKLITELEPTQELDFKNFIKKRDEILKLSRNILKIEWERVKEEANGCR